MPVSITKNNIDKRTILKMVQKAFLTEKVKEIVELTEGFFNVAFRIGLEDKNVILKIAPPVDTEIMTYEKNIMYSEVDVMKIIAEKAPVPVPKILFYDNSHDICESDYFFMDMLQGSSFSSIMDNMSQEEKDKIYFEMGKYTQIINSIHNNKFGYYGQKEKQNENWYITFKEMIMDTYSDAKYKDIIIPISQEEILILLEKDKNIFENVHTPKLVHWDIWAGNVFVKNNRMEGIIDFERCLWADELMEVGFRTYGYQKAFYKGYGIDKLSDEEKRRAKWYDIYLFLISCLECRYRMYDNTDTYVWGCDMLNKSIVELLKSNK